MPFEVAEYSSKFTLHTIHCPTISTVPRYRVRGSIFEIGVDKEVRLCIACRPKVYVINRVRARVNGVAVEEQIAHFKRRNKRPLDNLDALDVDPVEDPAAMRDVASWGEWTAACQSTHPATRDWLRGAWFDDHAETWWVGAQKAICFGCDIRARCLEQGVWGMEPWGVWGGATVEEREKLLVRWLEEGREDWDEERVVNNVIGFREARGILDARAADGEPEGVGGGAREGPGTGEDVPEVRAGRNGTREVEVRWPRSYDGRLRVSRAGDW